MTAMYWDNTIYDVFNSESYNLWSRNIRDKGGRLGELGERFNPGALAGPLNTTVMSINPNNSKNEPVGKALLSFFTAGQGSY